jgi:hypothetical protein
MNTDAAFVAFDVQRAGRAVASRHSVATNLCATIGVATLRR